MKKKKTIIYFLILCLAALIVVFSGVDSFAKYVLSQNDKLEGAYVDFRLSYIGESQTAVLYETIDSDVTYEFEGDLPLSIVNEKDGETSKRDLKYTITTPNASELALGYVTDAWGTEYPIAQTSQYYDVTILDKLGNVPTAAELSEMTSFEADELKTVPINLKIKRLYESKLGNTNDLETTEIVSLILQTTIPYKTVQIINIKVSNSLVIIDPSVQKYFGFKELEIDINTSRNYAYSDSSDTIGSFTTVAPTKLVFTISNSTLFDKERFIHYVENNYVEYLDSDADYSKIGYKISSGATNYTITLFVPTASNLKLFFYIDNDTSITVKAFFKNAETGTEHDYTSLVAGITDGQVY